MKGCCYKFKATTSILSSVYIYSLLLTNRINTVNKREKDENRIRML